MLTNLVFQIPLAALLSPGFAVNAAVRVCRSCSSLSYCSRTCLSVALRLSLSDVSELTCEASVHTLPHEEEAEVAHQVVGEVQLRRHRLQRRNVKREQRWKLRYRQVDAQN